MTLFGDVHEPLWRLVRRVLRGKKPTFPGSGSYWEQRYRDGGTSGAGSYGKFAEFKAKTINEFVRAKGVISVIEFGCGDGNQLLLAEYPSYLGVDVSETAIEQCRSTFDNDPTKTFRQLSQYAAERADLSLSLDVIYHLVEDRIFESHMASVFDAADKYVIVYSSNTDDDLGQKSPHVRHRKFSFWVERERPQWRLDRVVANPNPFHGNHLTGSFADFFFYERQ